MHLCKKDSCPSNIVESIAAGVPVVTTNLCGGAAEMCQLTKGCEVVYEGKQVFEKDYIYREPYNKMPETVRKKFVKVMINIVRKKTRVELPEQLSIEHVAQRYLDILKEISGGSSEGRRIYS